MKKRISAIIICLALVISMFPVTAFAEDAKIPMTIKIDGNQATFDYDGQTHSVKGITAQADRPEFDITKLECGQTNMELKNTEPGVYKVNIDPSELKYHDPTVDAEFIIGDPIKLTINEPTGGPAIEDQPEDTSTYYPRGAFFAVTAENPSDIVGYQWFEWDGYHWFELAGHSAITNHLIVTSTDNYADGHKFRCRLTGRDGKVTYTDQAELSITNKSEQLKVLYVREYGLLPGEEIDLEQYNLGSGVVSYADNGTDVTLTNVHMTNEVCVYDYVCSDSPGGIMLVAGRNTEPTYNIHLKGETVINNIFHDQYYQGGTDLGVIVPDSSSVRPDINIIGDELLTLKGGSIGILGSGHVNLQAPLKTIPNNSLPGGRKMFFDGIRADSVTVAKGQKVDMGVNGGGLIGVATDNETPAFVTIEDGAEVNIRSNAVPPVGEGVDAVKQLIHSKTITITNATVQLFGTVDPDDFPDDAVLDSFSAMIAEKGKGMTISGSDIQIKMTAEETNRHIINELNGILCDDRMFNISDSKFDINIGSKFNMSSLAMSSMDGIKMVNSTFKANVLAQSNAAGIIAKQGLFTVTDSNLEANVEHKLNGEIEGYKSKGLTVNFSKEGYQMKATVSDGAAFAVNTGETGDKEKGYDPTYVAKKTKLNGAEVISPAKAAISSMTRREEAENYYYETIYDLSDTSKPASSATIAYKTVKPTPTPTPTPTVKAPGKVKITKAAKKSAKKLQVKLKKVKRAKGYQIAVYKSNKNAKKNKKALVKKYTKKTKITIKSKKFKKRKKLYVKARAYALNGKKKVFGKWSKIKKAKKK